MNKKVDLPAVVLWFLAQQDRLLSVKLSPLALPSSEALFYHVFALKTHTHTSIQNRCSSYVGRRGGRQDVTIGRGCIRLGTCQHELFHALGTIHEQSRPDRDAHVRINWDNIRQGEECIIFRFGD